MVIMIYDGGDRVDDDGDDDDDLQLLGLLDQLSHFLLSLGRPDLGVLGSLLTDIGPVHGIVFLHLHGLHLLLYCVHGRATGAAESRG